MNTFLKVLVSASSLKFSKGRLVVLSVLSVCIYDSAFGQYSFSGMVLNHRTQQPVEFAVVAVPASGLWTTTNKKGEFAIKNIPQGKTTISVQYLGFVKREYEYTIDKNISGIIFLMDEDNLALSEVEITAKKGDDLATSFVMDRNALDHLQMLNVTDVSALLPGGKTNTALHLATTTPQRFEINGNAGELGNATFGVGVEIDGVRLSNNGTRDGTATTTLVHGVDTKNISPSNIESIEVVTGIPSVEYGDITNGMVKINTRKGVSPYIVELSTRPNTKLAALSKGINLGNNKGVLNVHLDHTKSISNLASPYTSYDRNSLSFNYSNTFNHRAGKPLILNVGVTGNVGGYNSKNDPDMFANTYTKHNDHVLRANFSAKWLLRKSWITNLEASGTLNYNDKQSEVSDNKSASSSVVSIRTTEEGYHVGQTYATNPNAPIILIPPGYWYEIRRVDNKLINYSGKLKANWFRKYGHLNNNLMVGADFSVSGNNGRGAYYGDIQYAPTWREYRYDQESFINNYALYAEDMLSIPIDKSTLKLSVGIRTDITDINGSEYGTVNSWSPRLNARYIFWEKTDRTISDFNVKIGWGKTVKLPGFDALYATPTYRDILTFTPGTTASGETFYGYYTIPRTRVFNPHLIWQSNVQREIAVNMKIAGHRVFITASQDKTSNPYVYQTNYEPFYYKTTGQADLEQSSIPSANRLYTVHPQTGIVTVTDITGTHSPEQLTYTDRYAFITNTKYVNGSPVTRSRITWTVDFKQIKPLRTSLRVDGNYYYYKGLEETISAYMPNATQLMANGQPYKYIGFFMGRANSANGDISRSVDMNFTVSTHIPALRLILSARLETSLYKFSRNLSEQSNGKQRGFVLDDRDAYVPSAAQTDIYGENRFVGLYPDYYVSLDDLNTKIPFAETFLWAKDNDVALYNELAKMVIKTNTNYYFNKNGITNYYSANFAATKEIGRFASISFFANNFFNNMAKVRYRWSGTETSLFGSSLITQFNYGASLKLKL